ncbi:MAG: TauD/TfdA family dioxygenase [Alphaproteobacteria bacterium]|jgi:taurine dioxygenase|nr:TauD/TfdA family dioxygenase [Alphaproteobacteria bacterium]|tara:strand:- start:100 stop:936 length:837 start_codon:yes stop_codon:yes gene_type:complete
MAYSKIEVTPYGGAVGAEVGGVDLGELDNETFAEIEQALYENLVLFFHDQDITEDEQVAFAARFGPIGYYPFVEGLRDHPEIVPVLKEAGESLNFGGVWHSDTAYLEKPPMGSVLYAKELPPVGGDTLWSNMYLAYERLSGGMKDVLDGLKAVNSSRKGPAAITREARIEDHGKEDAADYYEAVHPAIRIHPATGKKAIYVNIGHTANFEGMTEEESAPILNYLFEHAIRPEFTCRFKWEVGDVAVWDNRCAQHYAMNDYHGHRRLMHRVTIEGEAPA